MKKVAFLIGFLIVSIAYSHGQNNKIMMDDAEKRIVIDTICAMLNRTYIFPDIATQMAQKINKEYESGVYNLISDHKQFGELITLDLQSISKDKHLNVRFAPDEVKISRLEYNNSKDENEEEKIKKIKNYGFNEIKVFDGNVGYIKLEYFDDSQEGFRIASSAMNFLSNADVIIFDLQENGGGSPKMIQLISSYIYDEELHQLNSIYNRETNTTTQMWTLPYIPGKRNTDCIVYVLTSRSTFSAAEGFAYELKNSKRGIIIGETTAGGAHPMQSKVINDNFIISLPYGRAVNPITKSNWEGTGVQPDISTSRSNAFDVAYLDALKKLIERDKNPEFKHIYQWAMDGLDAKLNPIILNENILKNYTGVYGTRNIVSENGYLYYQREGRARYKLTLVSTKNI